MKSGNKILASLMLAGVSLTMLTACGEADPNEVATSVVEDLGDAIAAQDGDAIKALVPEEDRKVTFFEGKGEPISGWTVADVELTDDDTEASIPVTFTVGDEIKNEDISIQKDGDEWFVVDYLDTAEETNPHTFDLYGATPTIGGEPYDGGHMIPGVYEMKWESELYAPVEYSAVLGFPGGLNTIKEATADQFILSEEAQQQAENIATEAMNIALPAWENIGQDTENNPNRINGELTFGDAVPADSGVELPITGGEIEVDHYGEYISLPRQPESLWIGYKDGVWQSADEVAEALLMKY